MEGNTNSCSEKYGISKENIEKLNKLKFFLHAGDSNNNISVFFWFAYL